MLALADRWLGRYTRALDMLSGLCLAIMVVLVFGTVVLRYTANSGITVSEELSRWLFVWLTFMGAVVALREHGHLGTDVLVSRLPAAGKKVCLVLAQVAMLYVSWLLLKGSWGADGDQCRHRSTGHGGIGGHLLRQRCAHGRVGHCHSAA